ncbi:MAG: hypothetical protein HDQ93_04360 [Desulfovibrio sp.]|nr:hypothetical protein [Desulfovibrio sp.]
MDKNISDLKIVDTAQALPTIEIDADSAENGEHREILEACLVRWAEKHPEKIVSIYDYVTPSINFGRPTQSVFFAMAGSQPLLKEFYDSLGEVKGLRYRFAEYLSPREMQLAYHIEGGQAWRRDDMSTFSSIDKK